MESTKEKISYTTDGHQLLEEMEPILKDYFVAEFSMTADGLVMSLENGQKFKLMITEVK